MTSWLSASDFSVRARVLSLDATTAAARSAPTSSLAEDLPNIPTRSPLSVVPAARWARPACSHRRFGTVSMIPRPFLCRSHSGPFERSCGITAIPIPAYRRIGPLPIYRRLPMQCCAPLNIASQEPWKQLRYRSTENNRIKQIATVAFLEFPPLPCASRPGTRCWPRRSVSDIAAVPSRVDGPGLGSSDTPLNSICQRRGWPGTRRRS